LYAAVLATCFLSGVVQADPARGIVVDNEDKAGYREIGVWKTVRHRRANGASYRVNRVGTGKDMAIFTPVLKQPGNYQVYVKSGAGRGDAAHAKYRVYHADGVVEVSVEQSKPSWSWNFLGTFRYEGNQNIEVQVSDAASKGKLVAADAVSFVYSAPLEITVDNKDRGFMSSKSWLSRKQGAGYAGSDYQVRKVGDEMDVARWEATLSDTGRYEVFARWTADRDRATAAPYLVFHRGGVSKITIDQSKNGNQWISLGVYELPAGTLTRVALSNWTTSGKYVVADAVKFVSQGQVEPFVKIETPDHMSAVPNPVSVTFRTGGCVQKVRFGVDGEQLHAVPLSAEDGKFTYTFGEINRAHYLTLTGYDAHGNEVARDQIVFTPERSRSKPNKPEVHFAKRRVAKIYKNF